MGLRFLKARVYHELTLKCVIDIQIKLNITTTYNYIHSIANGWIEYRSKQHNLVKYKKILFHEWASLKLQRWENSVAVKRIFHNSPVIREYR